MYPIARALQFAGLVILPIGVLAQLQNQLTLWQFLTMAAFGAALFYIGYILQGVAGGK